MIAFVNMLSKQYVYIKVICVHEVSLKRVNADIVLCCVHVLLIEVLMHIGRVLVRTLCTCKIWIKIIRWTNNVNNACYKSV